MKSKLTSKSIKASTNSMEVNIETNLLPWKLDLIHEKCVSFQTQLAAGVALISSDLFIPVALLK